MLENADLTNHVVKDPIILMAGKKYFILAGVILFGSISHAIEDTRKSGWMGLGWFFANVFVAAFVGMLFAQLASMVSVNWIYAAGGVGGYMGPAAFKYIRTTTLARLGIVDKPDNKE